MTTFISNPCQAFPALQLSKTETIQRLWSGYGEIARYFSKVHNKTLIVKQVTPPNSMEHPRGWNTPLSHQRKIHSYAVELAFYRDFSARCAEQCRLPGFLGFAQEGENFILLLEDIDAAGYGSRKNTLTLPEIKACLSWLASFHALFVQEPSANRKPSANREPSANITPSANNNQAYKGLWPIACYWHLDTRPDEFATMPDCPLKTFASEIDNTLNGAKFQTLVHGDAKLANFCFDDQNNTVAALDFQYVGGGVGIKDVMMFLGSCMDSQQLFEHDQRLLSHYFQQLENGLAIRQKDKMHTIDFTQLKTEWLALYPFAWADFHRFLSGWKPDHFKINAYMHHQTKICLQMLNV